MEEQCVNLKVSNNLHVYLIFQSSSCKIFSKYACSLMIGGKEFCYS